MLLFRQRVYRALRPQQVPGIKADYVGDELDLPVALAPGASCRMELRGTTWELRNAGAAMLPAGARVRVTAVTGVELRVERVGG
jgi:membrane protein implicated in regulation of membrane protease activity